MCAADPVGRHEGVQPGARCAGAHFHLAAAGVVTKASLSTLATMHTSAASLAPCLRRDSQRRGRGELWSRPGPEQPRQGPGWTRPPQQLDHGNPFRRSCPCDDGLLERRVPPATDLELPRPVPGSNSPTDCCRHRRRPCERRPRSALLVKVNDATSRPLALSNQDHHNPCPPLRKRRASCQLARLAGSSHPTFRANRELRAFSTSWDNLPLDLRELLPAKRPRREALPTGRTSSRRIEGQRTSKTLSSSSRRLMSRTASTSRRHAASMRRSCRA